ncbi:MAG: Crp/Fnr family transcriptional regulator [Acidobacteriaceae bacterium]
MHTRLFKNKLLNALDPLIIQHLDLYPVTFEVGHQIEFPGEPIRNLVFVEVGMASMTTTFKNGSQVEVGMFGYESVIGISALMGTKRSLNRVYTQIAGSGFMANIETARNEFNLGGQFHNLALRYVQSQLLQSSQSTGCNAKHEVEERLARWLLICSDRANSDTFAMSHEFLADMLGSTRPTLTMAAKVLKNAGLIEYARGVISIRDTKGLEGKACECYHVIKDHLDNYAEFDTGLVA